MNEGIIGDDCFLLLFSRGLRGFEDPLTLVFASSSASSDVSDIEGEDESLDSEGVGMGEVSVVSELDRDGRVVLRVCPKIRLSWVLVIAQWILCRG